MTAPKGYIKELDGIRAVAVLLVIIWHYGNNLTWPLAGQYEAINSLRYYTRLSWAGVDLFFVLSGFLIGGILIDMKKSKPAFVSFYMRRAFRIIPIYAVLLLTFILLKYVAGIENVWLFGDADFSFWPYVLFLQNFYMTDIGSFGPNWLGITWSLAVEEQFYLLLPPLVYIFRKNRAALIGAVCLLVLLAPAFRFLYHEDIGAYLMVFCRADALLCGVLAAILCRYKFERKIDVRINLAVTALCALSLISILSHYGTAKIFSVRLHSELAVFCAALIYLIVKFQGAKFLAPFRANGLVYIGSISYALYLVHQPVSGLLFHVIKGAEPAVRQPGDFGIVLAAIGISISISALSLALFERPLRKYAASRWPR